MNIIEQKLGASPTGGQAVFRLFSYTSPRQPILSASLNRNEQKFKVIESQKRLKRGH